MINIQFNISQFNNITIANILINQNSQMVFWLMNNSFLMLSNTISHRENLSKMTVRIIG
jgi:hypothetical protein